MDTDTLKILMFIGVIFAPFLLYAMRERLRAPKDLLDHLCMHITLVNVELREIMQLLRRSISDDKLHLRGARRLEDYEPYQQFQKRLNELVPLLAAEAAGSEKVWQKVSSKYKTAARRKKYSQTAAEIVAGAMDEEAHQVWDIRDKSEFQWMAANRKIQPALQKWTAPPVR
jgi:hypothetical protein